MLLENFELKIIIDNTDYSIGDIVNVGYGEPVYGGVYNKLIGHFGNISISGKIIEINKDYIVVDYSDQFKSNIIKLNAKQIHSINKL